MKAEWKNGETHPPTGNGDPVLTYYMGEFRVMNYWNNPDYCGDGQCPTFIDPEVPIEAEPDDVVWCELPEQP